MFKWLAILLTVIEVAALIAVAYYVSGPLALSLSSIVCLTIGLAVLWHIRSNSVSYRIKRISPEDITSYEGGSGSDPASPAPEDISRSIVERASQIQSVLFTQTPSQITIEMCAIGYRACVNDMITLSHLINEELPLANLRRRLTLRRARRRATEALAGAREALPPGALRATHQEQQ